MIISDDDSLDAQHENDQVEVVFKVVVLYIHVYLFSLLYISILICLHFLGF